MDVLRQLALLTDQEASGHLTSLLSGWQAENPDLKKLIDSPELPQVVQQIGQQLAEGAFPLPPESKDPAKVRALLVAIAEQPELRPRLEQSLHARRETLGPITATLVLGGVLLLLSTGVRVQVKKEGKKVSWDVQINKPGLPDAVLKLFFSLF